MCRFDGKGNTFENNETFKKVFIASLCKIVNSFFSLDTLRQISLSRYEKDKNVHGVKMTSLQMRL